MKSIIQKTNGKKTTAVSILSVLFEALMIYRPDMLDENLKSSIRVIINSGLLSTLLHKAWRNRKDIINFVKNIFKK